MIPYTAEELDHLRFLQICVSTVWVWRTYNTADDWREWAQQEKYSHAIAACLEKADEVECGFEGGEFF